MKTLMTDIKTQDGVCDAFVAYPDDGKQHPAVLFYMDAIGPRDYLYEMAKKIAERGYYVLQPNMFYRVKKAPYFDMKFPLGAADLPKLWEKLGPLFQSFTPEQGMKDAQVFLDFLGKQKEVRPGKIGITGYCMGAGLALRTAALFPDRVGAAAGFHGARLATDAPDSPHRLVGKIKAEVYVGHADKDQHNPPEQIELLEKALSQAGVRHETEVYPGAMHGYTMADLPAYNEAGAKRHWEKLFPLFERNLN